MPLINCEVNLIFTWSRDCIITNSEGEEKFVIKSNLGIKTPLSKVPILGDILF